LPSERQPSRGAAQIASEYEARRIRFSAEADELGRRSHRVGNLRGATFVGALVAFGDALFGSDSPLSWVIGIACVLVFAGLVFHHATVVEKENHKRRWARVNESAVARSSDAWRTLAARGDSVRPQNHPYADDLDLFGPGSLYQRISVAHTRYGERTLAGWLDTPANSKTIRARQGAVRALSSELEFRQALEAESLAIVERRGREPGTFAIGEGPDPEALLRWAESPPVLLGKLWVRVLAWALPLATIAGLVLSFGFGYGMIHWGAPLLLELAVLYLVRQPAAETFTAVSATEGAFLRYGAMLELVEKLGADSEWVQARQAELRDPEGISPSRSMRTFRSRVGWYDLRHNGMVYPFINALLLWDVHCTLALESWKAHSGRHARRWFQVLGEMEAMSSLAGLLHDEPTYCLPEVHEGNGDGSPRARGHFEAEGLGHPLISASRRVTNDVPALEGGHALLVTGSNMSGKSTFLRSIGVACVLAFAGGPVCARRLSLSRCRVGTSIRVSDSLASGVSHFYAEIEKLKAVVDATELGEPVLFLLDEILHGTNSRERQVGARWVLAELLERGAFGIVTTHDMELCRLTPELMEHVTQAHFRESVKDEQMTFDYQLRQGPVTAGNALRLMQLVGLGVPLD
jgi:hypothetical protein